MTETCPECGSEFEKDYGGKFFACGSIDQPNGRFRQSELCRVNAQLTAAQARIAELEAFARDIRDNSDCDSDAHYYETPCLYCMATQLLAAIESKSTNSGPAAGGV
jgi:hypothetical protein